MSKEKRNLAEWMLASFLAGILLTIILWDGCMANYNDGWKDAEIYYLRYGKQKYDYKMDIDSTYSIRSK